MKDINTEERAESIEEEVRCILREFYGDNGALDELVAMKITLLELVRETELIRYLKDFLA